MFDILSTVNVSHNTEPFSQNPDYKFHMHSLNFLHVFLPRALKINTIATLGVAIY